MVGSECATCVTILFQLCHDGIVAPDLPEFSLRVQEVRYPLLPHGGIIRGGTLPPLRSQEEVILWQAGSQKRMPRASCAVVQEAH